MLAMLTRPGKMSYGPILVKRLATPAQRWFSSQCTRYRKLTSTIGKCSLGAFQLTERAKWVLKHFGFLYGPILKKALMHTAGFSTSSSQMRPDESRGPGTDNDVERMLTSVQALS